MSLAMWFYPLLLLALSVPSPDSNLGNLVTEKRRIWDMLLDSLGLLPWIFSIANPDASAAWLGFELLTFILIASLLKSIQKSDFQEAWIKLAINCLLGSLLLGLAAGLSGIFPLSENLFFPFTHAQAQSIKPVLAGVLFIVGLAIKLGLPPLQQGVIDGMGAMDAHQHRRWALTLRLGLLFAVWHLAPSIWGPLNHLVQQFFAACLVGTVVFALLVASVQAGIQRTLSYMGTLLVLPAALGSLFIQPSIGFEPLQVWSIWIFSSIGFILMAMLYRQMPEPRGPSEVKTLLWIDTSSPALLPGWQMTWKLWWAWSFIFAIVLMSLSFQRKFWVLCIAGSCLALAVLTVAKLQMGIQLRRHGSPLGS